MREPFILFQRASGGNGGRVYYVKFWSVAENRYISVRSVASLIDEVEEALPSGTSPTAKAGARRIVESWLKTHSPTQVRGKAVLFLDYLSSFWADEGVYAKSLRARGKHISAAYLQNNRRIVRTHVADFLKKCYPRLSLPEVTPAVLESLVMGLYDAGNLSARTINTIRQSVSVPLGEAYRLGLIRMNPAKQTAKLAEANPEREILTINEARAFFARTWTDPRLYAINLLSATTGLRLGECRGLQVADIGDNEIRVTHNWQDEEGLKAPKWGSSRMVPLPSNTRDVLLALGKSNPWQDGFVFWGASRGRPIGKRIVDDDFADGIRTINIAEDERKRRRLTFHSWRHWYVSMLRGQTADHNLRAVTGHRTEAMTERYTEIPKDTRDAVASLAGSIL